MTIRTEIGIIVGMALLSAPLLWAQQENFQPSGKPIMQIFGDYYYKVMGDIHDDSKAEFADEKRDFQAFLFRRVYLGYQYQFTPKIMGKVILEANDALRNTNETRGVYAKYAYVEIKDLLPLGVPNAVLIGAVPTPTWYFSEKFYGYRFLEKTALHMRKMGSSNDAGLKIETGFGDALPVTAVLMVGNGRNGKYENDRYKLIYASLQGKFLRQRLWVQLYGDYRGFRQEEIDGSVRTLKAFAGYNGGRWRVGIEFGQQSTRYVSDVVGVILRNGVTGGLDTTVSAFVLSTFARYRISTALEALVRFDYYDPNSNAEDRYTEAFLLAGLRWMLNSHVVIMPNFWINGYIAQGNMPETRVDVVPRLTFFVKY